MAMDVVDYEIKGAEMQFVEIELDPGKAVGEAGSLMHMDGGISMDTVFGDGSAAQGGLLGKLLGAGKRLVTGESLFTVYTNTSQRQAQSPSPRPYPGKIVAMDLRQLGGTLICQKDAFLCAARGVTLGIAFQRKISGFLRRRGLHHAAPRRRRPGLRPRRRHAGAARELAPGQELLRRHRLSRRVHERHRLRHPVRRQGQDGAVRRRGAVPRPRRRAGHGLAAEPAVLAARVARFRRRAAARRSREEGSVLGGFAAGGLLGSVLGGDDGDA